MGKCGSRPVEECEAVPREVARDQCSTHTEQECRNIVDTIQEQQCTQVPEEQCHDEAQCVTEQQCTTTQQCHEEQVCVEEQQCSTQVSTVIDTTLTEECVDVVEQVCTEAHVGTTTNVLGHSAGPLLGAIAGTRWRREADAEADADADADAQFFGGLSPADYAAASAGYA